jgi:hypothetical protein
MLQTFQKKQKQKQNVMKFSTNKKCTNLNISYDNKATEWILTTKLIVLQIDYDLKWKSTLITFSPN